MLGRRVRSWAIGCAAVAAAIGGLPKVASAVPSLQVGAPAGPTDTGTYADYGGTLSNPTETDTAVTSGFTLLVAASYSNGTTELLIGGQYTDPADSSITPNLAPGTMGSDWSGFGFNSVFNGKGAVVMATAPAGAGSVTLGGNAPFYTTGTFEDGFTVPNPPSNHDPIKDSDPDKVYMFFDVGNFNTSTANMPNFVDESLSSQSGEIKSLALTVADFPWVHFDLFALVSEEDHTSGPPSLRTYFVGTDLEGNPGSKDVTWKTPGTPPPPPPPPPPSPPPAPGAVPEPVTSVLGLMSLVGLGLSLGRRA